MSFFHFASAPIITEVFPFVCPVCAARRMEDGACPHHEVAERDGWAESNRAFCAWAHRNRKETTP